MFAPRAPRQHSRGHGLYRRVRMRDGSRMTAATDSDLYRRGEQTLLVCWEAIAEGSAGAAVIRAAGVTAAVFPRGPERSIYNNAVLERGLERPARRDALDAMEAAYAAAGVTEYAAWVHESDAGMRADLAARDYTVAETTRAMGMALEDIRAPRPELDLARPDWPAYVEYLERAGAPAGTLRHVDPSAFELLLACDDGETVATALAFAAGDDCGIYNVSTVERARRRGLGTALTARLAHDALARGCTTATLQSTPMAERVYAAVGFRDLGRILEFVPPRRSGHPPSDW
jgi:GNAT superfamily N-acetyltransferase